MGVVAHHHGEGPLERRRHDVGVAGELAAPQVDGLVDGAALEEVVALVGAAAGVEEGEHAGDEQRRAVVRDGEGSGEDGGRLAVLAVRRGEEEGVGGRIGLVQAAAFADEAALDDGAVVEPGLLGGDEVAGLDVDAGAGTVAERAVLEQRDAVELHLVAHVHLAQQAAARDAAAASHASDLGTCAFGLTFGHAVECGDQLRTVAVEGCQIGRLGRERREDFHRAAAAFVHRRHRDPVAERGCMTAFERRDVGHERLLADVVVADPRAVDAGIPADADPPFEAACGQLLRAELLRDRDVAPRRGTAAGSLEAPDFVVGQVAVLGHRLQSFDAKIRKEGCRGNPKAKFSASSSACRLADAGVTLRTRAPRGR